MISSGKYSIEMLQGRRLAELEMELTELKLKEPELRRRITQLRQKENELKVTYQEMFKEVEQITAETKRIDLKLKSQRLMSSYYIELMRNFKREIPDFLSLNEYSENKKLDEEIVALKTELNTLQKSYEELSKNDGQNEGEIQHYVQTNPSERMLSSMRNIRTLEMNIQMRKKELEQFGIFE